MNEAIRMQLSAFVDGELPENEAELLLRRLSQDAELRQEVGEYLAIGRFVRSEPGLAATDRLHERVAAAIDENAADVIEADPVAKTSAAIKPLAGVAVAASVALVAIFALQQTAVVDEVPVEASGTLIVEDMEPVPEFNEQQERQRQYLLNHTESSGTNGMNSRVVTLRFSEEVADEDAIDESEDQGEQDESAEAPTQP